MLADLLAKDGYTGKVRNAGVGGESSVTIAASYGLGSKVLLVSQTPSTDL